jgi:hypothetical protein
VHEVLKETGRDMIDKVPWASHFDHFYLTRKDSIDIVVSYFKDGLESNEFCICVTTEPLTAEEVRKAMGETVPDFPKYLGKGQIEMLSYAQWHLRGGCIEILNEALAKGFDSIRVTAFIGEQAFIWHMPWLEQGKPQPATPSQ